MPTTLIGFAGSFVASIPARMVACPTGIKWVCRSNTHRAAVTTWFGCIIVPPHIELFGNWMSTYREAKRSTQLLYYGNRGILLALAMFKNELPTWDGKCPAAAFAPPTIASTLFEFKSRTGKKMKNTHNENKYARKLRNNFANTKWQDNAHEWSLHFDQFCFMGTLVFLVVTSWRSKRSFVTVTNYQLLMTLIDFRRRK